MANRIEVPDDLKHLVEKRAGAERRKASDAKASGGERRRKARRAGDGKKKGRGKRKAD